MKFRINNKIRAREVQVIGSKGENLGVLKTEEAIAVAEKENLDLVEIAPFSNPPVAKIVDYGKFQYEYNKKQKQAKAGSKVTETKAIQVKIGTGDNDLAMKAKTASKWLSEGHRIKIELFLSGRAKYLNESFLKERLERLLHLISTDYKIADSYKKSPKGFMMTIEKA